MHDRLSKLVLSVLTVTVLDTGLPLGGSPGLGVSAQAQTEGNSEVSYQIRPDILTVEAVDHELESGWSEMIAGMHWMVALLLEIYPDRELYFLARDAELLYDTARLATQGTDDADRIHMINVSRVNARDWQLKGYLEQEGLTEESLRNGKKVVLVDTGFAGTISKAISNQYSEQARANISTHLMISENPRHPSARSLLIHLNPSANELHPTGIGLDLIHIEELPHFTSVSERFRFQNGAYHAMSIATPGPLGEVDRELSLRYMQDLRVHWNSQLFGRMREQIRTINQLLTSSDIRSAQERLLQLLRRDPTGIREAIIRDILDAQKNTGAPLRISLRDLQLSEAPLLSPVSHWQALNDPLGREIEIAIKYPQERIPELFKNQDNATIRALINANLSTELNITLAGELFRSPAQGAIKELQFLFIERVNHGTLLRLASRILSQPATAGTADVLDALVDQATPEVMMALGQHVFSKPHSRDKTDVLERLIEARDYDVHVALAQHVFSKPHTAGMKEQLKLLIETASDSWTYFYQVLAEFALSQPHAADKSDLLKLLIEKRNSKINSALARHVFSKAHARNKEDLIVLMIETTPSVADHLDLVNYVFTQAHTGSMVRAIDALVARGDRVILRHLEEKVFRKTTPAIRESLKRGMSTAGMLRCEHVFW